MKLVPQSIIFGALATTAALFIASATVVGGQAPAAPAPARRPAPAPATPAPAQRPAATGPRAQMAEDVFTNITVLKGVPADEFMASMGYISNALAVNCTYCHLGDGGGGWPEYAKDNDKKRTARRMILMMNAINKENFGGRRVVTCVSCHNGNIRPKVTSNMSVYYSVPTTDEPDAITRQAPGAPSAEQVIDKYIQAIGGAQKLAALTSYVAKGTFLSYGEADPGRLEIFVKAPAQRAEIRYGGSTTVYDGRNGWHAVPEAISPLSQRVLNGAELDGARLDAILALPGQLKTALTAWRGAIPTALGDADVQVIQGTTASGFPVKLYFDDESGLLLRQIRYIEAAIGRSTWQYDYSDYREVAGVKIPFKWTFMWQSGQSVVELTDVQPNVAIDAARFTRPAGPASEAPAR
ncbi:MAG: photosynthetic reaction center cytochrome c subunit family protein [Vicinamibacterales bacterium]